MAGKKVKIKRVAKPKKPPGTRQKILAGLGVGSALLSAGGGQVAKQPQNSRIVSPAKTSDKKGKIKQVLTNIFGVPEAKAYGGMNSVNSSGKTIEELMINSGYNPELVNSHFMGGQGPSSSDLYNSSGLALGGGGQAASGGGSSQIGAVSGDMAQGEANAASAFAEATSGSGETPTEGNSLPSFGQAEGAGSGSGEGGEASPGMVSTQGPFMEDTEPITIPITPSDNYQQMYTTPPPSTTPLVDAEVANLPVNNNPHSENLVPVGYSQPIYSEESPSPTVAGSYTPYTTATPAPVFSNTSDANTFTDAEANTTGGQYGTYPSAASFFVDPSSQDTSASTNPAVVDGTAGMFGQGSGLDASGNAVFAPSSDNNWDSVWQNTTGQNPNTAISPSTAYGGGSSWEQAVLQSGGSVGDSYIVVNNQPYTRQQWESGLLPGEQGPVSPSVTPESPFVNIVSDAVPIEYSPATYDYLGNRTDTQKAPAVNQEITNPFSLGQPGLGDAVAVLPTAETAATASAVKTQSASAEEFFTKPNVLTEAELSQQFQGEGAGYEDSLESRSAGLKNEPEYSNVNLFAEKPTATSAGLPFTSWNGNVGVDASGKQWILEADGSLKDASNLIVEPTTSLPLLFIYPTLEFTDTLTEKSGTIKIDGRLAFISMTEDGGYKVGVGADDPNPKYYTAEDFYKLVAKQIPQTNGISRLSSLMVDDVFSGEKFSSKVLDWFTMTLDDGKQVIVQPQRDGTFKIGDAGGSEKPEILSYKEFLDWLPTSYQNNRYLLNKSPDVVPVGAVQEFVTKSGDRVLVTKVEENNYTIITNPQTAEQQKKIGLSLDEVKNIVVMPEYAYASSSFSDSSNKKYSSDANQDLVTSSSRSIGQGQTETSSVGQNFTPTWLKDAAPSEAAVLEDPGIVNMDSQIQGSDESKIKTADSDSIAKKGVIDNAKSGLLKVGQALGGLSGVKSTKSAATAAAPAASEDMVVPDKTIKVGKKSVDVYNLGTDQNPIWTDFEGNLYKASGKSMVVVGSTKYEVLKDAQGQPMNLNTMSVLDISKVWSQGNNGSLDVDKGLWQNILSAGKAAGNQVKNNKTISAVGGVYTVGGVGAYGATKEVIKQVKDKTANDYLGMIYNWAWPQDWESGGAKVVTASGQEPVLKIAGKEIPRSQVQNMTTAQLTDLVNQKINGPNKP